MIVEIQKRNGSVEEMGVDEFSRWMCLVEAFDFIEKKSKELKIGYEKLLNSNAIDKFIIERYPSMRHDVGIEVEMGLL